MPKEQTFGEKATRGFAWNYLYKLTEFGLVNFYTILVVRHFGPTISAPYAVFTALCSTASMVCGFAVDGVLLRYIQRISLNEKSGGFHFNNLENLGLPSFLTTLFAFRILVVILVSIVLSIALIFLPTILPSFSQSIGSIGEFSPYLIIYLFAQAIVAFSTFTLIGLLEIKRVFIASLLSRGLLLAGGLYLLLQNAFSLESAIVLFVLSAIVNSGYLLLALRKEVDRHSASGMERLFSMKGIVREIWRFARGGRQLKLFLITPVMLYGITTWGSDILSTVLGRQPDILMMRAMLGENSSEIAYYLSASIVLLVTEYVFLFGLGGTLISIFSKLAQDDENEKSTGVPPYPRLSQARKEIAGFQNVVLLPLCAYMMVFAPDVMRSLYGEKYDAAIPMIRTGLGALALSVGMFGGGMQITSLVAIGKERLVFRNRLFWGILNLIANIFLIRFFGGMGAIIGTQFSNAFACGTESFFARKFIRPSFDLIGTARIMLISAFSVVAAFFLLQIAGSKGAYVLNSTLSAVFTGGLVGACYYGLKVPESSRIVERLKGLFPRSKSAILSE